MKRLFRFIFHGWTFIAVFALSTMQLISKLPSKRESHYLDQIRPYVSLPLDTIYYRIEWKYLPIPIECDTNYSFVLLPEFKKNEGWKRNLDDFLRHQFPQGLRPCTVYVHCTYQAEPYLYIPMYADHKHVWMLPSEIMANETPQGLTYTCVFTDDYRYWKQQNADRARNPEIWDSIDRRTWNGDIPVILNY